MRRAFAAAPAAILIAAASFTGFLLPTPAGAAPDPLRIVLPSEITPPDPHHRFWMTSESMYSAIFDRLVRIDGEGSVQPELATSWSTDDGLTYRFALRPGVTFHDGSTFDAADVVFSLKRAKTFPEGVHQARLKGMVSMRASGPLEIELKMRRMDPLLLRKLALIAMLPKGTPQPMVEPIGTGPYRWAGLPSPNRILLEAFASYWGPPPAEPRVELIMESDGQAALSLLKEGKVDLLELAHSSADQMDSSDEYWIFSSLSPGITYLDFQVHQKPFDNVHFRRAVDLALDRRAMVETVFAGYARAAAQLAGPSSFGFDPSIQPTPLDLEAARAELKKSGAGPEEKIFELFTTEPRRRLAELISSQLAKIGLQVHTRIVEWEELVQRLDEGRAPVYLMGWGNIVHDLGDVFEHLAHTRDPESRRGLANVSRFSDPTVDALIEKAGRTLDSDARFEAIQEITELVNERAVLLPLVYEMTLWAAPSCLRWEPRSDGLVNPATMKRKIQAQNEAQAEDPGPR